MLAKKINVSTLTAGIMTSKKILMLIRGSRSV